MIQIQHPASVCLWMGLPLGIHPLQITEKCTLCKEEFTYQTLGAWTCLGWSVNVRDLCDACVDGPVAAP